MVFQMVRELIGDDAFFKALRAVYRERLFQEASWDDFSRAFSRSAGTNLAPFMKQWLIRPGGPRLALSDVKRQHDGGGWRVSGNIVQSQPFYALQVPLHLTTSHDEREEHVIVRGERTPFTMSSPDAPLRLSLDPEVDIFRLLSPREIPATVNRLKGARSLLAVVTQGCRADAETLRLLLESIGQGSARVIREEELGNDHSSRDILFCGIPRRDGLLPAPAREISYSPEGFVVAGESFTLAGDALFFVTTAAGNPERVVALFLPRSAEAAAKCVTKITHYGRYGYLAFVDGENRKRGVLLPDEGGSVVTFSQRERP
jgi:hypothetical protein